MRWLKKGIPATQNLGDPAKPLDFDVGDDQADEGLDDIVDQSGNTIGGGDGDDEDLPAETVAVPVAPPKANEYEWQWKPELETTRKTFFL
jgi:ribosome production factor 1